MSSAVVVKLIVLTQMILAVIVAVWGAQHGVREFLVVTVCRAAAPLAKRLGAIIITHGLVRARYFCLGDFEKQNRCLSPRR